MTRIVDYYLSPTSPWAYLGHERLREMCRRHAARINVRPCDLGGRIFPVSGGLPLKQRAPQRQAYRITELKRWRAYLNMPLTLEPKYFPADAEPASRLIIAASRLSEDAAMALSGALLRACWAQERNIADIDTLKAILAEQGFAAEPLMHLAASTQTRAAYDACTQEAIDRGVFGAPTYSVDGELFWGQDRLEFVERALLRS